MALTKFALRLIAPHLSGARVLALGYPDLLATRDEVRKLFSITGPLERVNERGGPAHKHGGETAETVEAFRAAGAVEVRCVDLFPSRGVEEVVDLNEPWSVGAFDLVIDAGTIEHCANIGQALKNAAGAVGPGGRIFHSPPVTMVNHGFYNVCPTLLWDFYTQNGWGVEHLSGFKVHRDFDSFDVEPTRRGRTPEESALYFLARRSPLVAPLHWPTQTKYLAKQEAA